MSWILSILSALISVCAFGFSLLTYRQQRQKDRRDLFLQIDQRLVAPEITQGRGILLSRERNAQDFANMRSTAPTDFHAVNSSISMFEVVAMYIERSYIDRDLVFEEWGVTMAKTWKYAQPFIEARKETGEVPWPNLFKWGPIVSDWVEAHPVRPIS